MRCSLTVLYGVHANQKDPVQPFVPRRLVLPLTRIPDKSSCLQPAASLGQNEGPFSSACLYGTRRNCEASAAITVIPLASDPPSFGIDGAERMQDGRSAFPVFQREGGSVCLQAITPSDLGEFLKFNEVT